jgi:hypothetical protein
MDEVLEAIPAKVDDQMNESMCAPYSNNEIRASLFQMGPTKTPRPDGFPALLYQTHWDLVQEEICDAIRSFLAREDISKGLCDSIIVLVLKVSKAKHLANSDPLACAMCCTSLRPRS